MKKFLALYLALLLMLGTVVPAFAVISATSNKCAANSAVSSSTIACTMPGAATNPSLIAVCVFWDSAIEELSSVGSDGGGNTYTERGATYATKDSTSAEMVDATNTSTATLSPQATFGTARTFKAIYAQEFLNVVTSGNGFDQSNVGTVTGVGSGTDLITSGSTGTTTQANELIWSCGHATNNSPTYTQGTGYTLSTQQAQWGSAEYKIVSATGTYIGTFTSSLSGNNAIVHVSTYKDVVAGGGGGTKIGRGTQAIFFRWMMNLKSTKEVFECLLLSFCSQ